MLIPTVGDCLVRMRVVHHADDRQKLGAALKNARTYVGLTQEHAAARLDLTRNRLHAIERGQAMPTADELRLMMELYATDRDGETLGLPDLVDALHPDDLAAVHHFAAILLADRRHREHIETRRNRLEQTRRDEGD